MDHLELTLVYVCCSCVVEWNGRIRVEGIKQNRKVTNRNGSRFLRNCEKKSSKENTGVRDEDYKKGKRKIVRMREEEVR